MFEYLVYIAPLFVAVALGLGLWLTDVAVTARARKHHKDLSLSRQSIKLALWFVAILATLLVLPVDNTTQGQLITIFGLIVTAVLTLSSTTFVANGLAGVMLRSVENFRPGDFLRVGEYFGRVTERGLLHTEIQTEDGDLTTLPNLQLISTPYTVLQSSGTIVSASVSIGYEVSRRDVESALLVAGADSGLEQPFVQIVDLQDYSVAYRVAGFLMEPKQLLSSRSNLRKHMLDVLHHRGIEIVSPAFMNQRRIDDKRFIPPTVMRAGLAEADSQIPEDKIFDKAEMAQAIEDLREEQRGLAARLEALKEEYETAPEARQPLLKMQMQYTKNRQEAVAGLLEENKNSAD